jgi:hypothetical protein
MLGRRSDEEFFQEFSPEQFLDHRDLTELGQSVSLADAYGEFSPIFEKMAFPQEKYTRFQGLDGTALYATSVSLSSEFAFIGSNGYNIYQGILHAYTPINESAWSIHSTILSPDGPNINFGLSVDHSGEFMIVGANAFDAYKGSAYIYQLINGQNWILTTRLYSSYPAMEGFGFKVAIHGHTALVATAINDVSVYQYDRATGEWSNTLKLTGVGPSDGFGNSIDVYGKYMVIGAPQAANGRGLVYVYKETASTVWSLDSILENPGNQWQYGYSVSIFNTSLAVGAVGFRDDTFRPLGTDAPDNTGFAYIYEYSTLMGKYETIVQSIASPVGHKSYFGVSLSLAQDKLVVGADGVPFGNNTGAAFIYFRTPGRPRDDLSPWQLNYSLPSPAGYKGSFGYAVDICDYYAASGAFGFDDLRGSVYLVGFPRPQPTMSPTLAPTGAIDSQSLNTITTAVAKQGKMMEILAIGVLVLVSVLTSACCIYLCCVPVVGKKKKKEEEEESPYTVHSYVGYSEMDEYMPPQAAAPPQWMPFFPQMPMMPMMMVPPPMPVPMQMMPDDLMMKKKMMDDDEFDIKKADENFVRKLFPYKVYGPRGYEEENATADALEREKHEDDKNGLNLTSETSAYDDDDTHYTSEPQQTRKPVSMETILEDENEDDTGSSSNLSPFQGRLPVSQRHALPYTHSSQYNMHGFQAYDVHNAQNNGASFFVPPSVSGDDVSSLSSQPSNLYGAASHNPHMFVPFQQPGAHFQNAPMYPAMNHPYAAPAPSATGYASDSSNNSRRSSSSSANYVAMAKQGYAKFRQHVPAHDDNASVSSAGSDPRPSSISHGDRVHQYAKERSDSDLASTTSNSDDTFVKRAKERYMQFLMKKNMTREERDSSDLMHEQSYAFLKPSHPQEEDEAVDQDQEEDGDDHTVSTMTGSVRSTGTGFYTESSSGSRFSQRSSNSLSGALALNVRPTSIALSEGAAPPTTTRNNNNNNNNNPMTIVKTATVERTAATTTIGEAPVLKLSKKIEFEELDEIKEFSMPVARTNSNSLLASKPVAAISGIEERELKEVKPMASIVTTRPMMVSTTPSTHAADIALALEQEADDARQKAIEELERARALAQTMAAEEELKRVQERNRIKEESRLRAEERARAQFALHKQRSDEHRQHQQQQQERQAVRSTASVANEALLAADRALASVQHQISSHNHSNHQLAVQVQNSVVHNTTVTNISTRTTTTNTTSTTHHVTSSSPSGATSSAPLLEEP